MPPITMDDPVFLNNIQPICALSPLRWRWPKNTGKSMPSGNVLSLQGEMI